MKGSTTISIRADALFGYFGHPWGTKHLLRVRADSCTGDAGRPSWCRVFEGNAGEHDNTSRWVDVSRSWW